MEQPSLTGATGATGAAANGAVDRFRHVVRLRLVSQKMVALQREGRIGYHAASIGEEVPIVAAALAARENDWIFPSVRGWGGALVRGLPIAAYVHHALGTAHAAPNGQAPP